jgi:hypothetical protein
MPDIIWHLASEMIEVAPHNQRSVIRQLTQKSEITIPSIRGSIVCPAGLSYIGADSGQLCGMPANMYLNLHSLSEINEAINLSHAEAPNFEKSPFAKRRRITENTPLSKYSGRAQE